MIINAGIFVKVTPENHNVNSFVQDCYFHVRSCQFLELHKLTILLILWKLL